MPTSAETVRNAIERIAPPEHAEEWDNVGELVRGSRDSVKHLFLTIDFTEPVLEEAIDLKCDMVIAYHPTIFTPVKRLGSVASTERVILRNRPGRNPPVFPPYRARCGPGRHQ